MDNICLLAKKLEQVIVDHIWILLDQIHFLYLFQLESKPSFDTETALLICGMIITGRQAGGF